MVSVLSFVDTEKVRKVCQASNQGLGVWSPLPDLCVLPGLSYWLYISQMSPWLLQASAGGKSDKSLLAKQRAMIWQGALKYSDA